MNISWTPANIGDAVEKVDTPSLVLDLDRFERNLTRLMNAARPGNVRVRPHAKSHKCTQIAMRQMIAGAVGVCCQKSAEAAVFLAAGIPDVLITNEVVGARKITRLAQLAQAFPSARLGVCVDQLDNVLQLATACEAQDAKLDVYVDLDVGQNRTGVSTSQAAVELARAVHADPRLNFMGLHAYAGNAQHRRGVPERRGAIMAAAQKVSEVRAALRAADLPCEIVTGGGTGTFIYEAASGIFNEVQPGSFVLMDADYARNEQDPNAPRFEHALMVLASVSSMNGDRITLDAGLKSFSTDSGPPLPAFAGWQVRGVSDEHTVLHRAGEGPAVALGDKALLIPGHCDPTVNLHDWIVVVRKGKVEDVWRIDARGASY